MTDEQSVDTAEGENARKRWPLIRRSHGFYRSEDGTMKPSTYDTDADGKESFVIAEPCWGCTHGSELFESSEAAHR